tara:strand:- start:76 stop:291 length:216 start_codon:yes stop_codon:yes gene_type:complete
MESSKTFTYKRSANIAIVKKNVLDSIYKEYDLKRSQFDPHKKSPNFFNTKLQHRMKVYYHSLYNLSSSPTK